MPPRLITAAILVFWLAMTAWLVEREVVPMMLAEAAPTIEPDLTDEIGTPVIAWTIYHKGKRAGSATSQVRSKGDRSLEMRATLNFAEPFAGINKLESMQLISDDRKLKVMSIKVDLALNIAVEVRGTVVDGFMEPRIFAGGAEVKGLDIGKVDLSQQTVALTPLDLVNRVRQVRDGQTFKVSSFDPLRGVKAPYVGEFLKHMKPPDLIGTVTTDTLAWDGHDVACYKIEYREPGKDIRARTWIRKLDGLVLQQESANLGMEMVLQRMPR